MTRLSRGIAIPLAIVIALGAAPLVTGCSIQNIVKGATGGQVDVGGTSIPSDFPKSVPIVDGKIIVAAAVGKGKEKVWNVTVQASGSDPAPGIEKKLKANGYKSTTVTPTEKEGSSIVASDDTNAVLIVVAKDKNDWVVSYSVGPAGDTGN